VNVSGRQIDDASMINGEKSETRNHELASQNTFCDFLTEHKSILSVRDKLFLSMSKQIPACLTTLIMNRLRSHFITYSLRHDPFCLPAVNKAVSCTY
jgi:hypothetical protein